MDIKSLLLVGCGKMGSALLDGWLDRGLPRDSIRIIEPFPSNWLKSQNISLNPTLDDFEPDYCVLAVKPQLIDEALGQICHLGYRKTIFVSIVAGTRFQKFESILGDHIPVVRAMPNTPAAIGKGISALVGNGNVRSEDLQKAELLLSAVGDTVRLDNEDLLDVVTGVSGSGPAYVFNLIETMIKAAVEEGLDGDVAEKLVISTVIGAGELARQSNDPPSQLRINVTSPKGTTEAGLKYLMNKENGLEQLIARTIGAAVKRSRELGNG